MLYCFKEMVFLLKLNAVKVWSWGINDLGTLGRPTVGVLDPDMPGQEVPEDILESQPLLVQTLVDDRFRAVRVAAGDSVSVALGENGQLKVWGSFRVSFVFGFLPSFSGIAHCFCVITLRHLLTNLSLHFRLLTGILAFQVPI